MRPGVEQSHFRTGLLACAWCCAQFLSGAALAQGESLEARQNLLKERAVAALKSGDTLALYAAMDDFRLLEKEGAEVPPGLFFSEAAAARSMNDPVRTMRAFDDYFRVSPSEGEVFSEALRVYAQLKRDIPETAWNLLEGMLPVPGGVARTDQASQGLVLQPKAGGEVVISPFSLGIREVTRSQFLEFVTATGYRPKEADRGGSEGCDPGSDDWTNPGFEQTGDHPVVCVSWDDASAYLTWLSQWSGVRFRLPTSAEWEHVGAGRNAHEVLVRRGLRTRDEQPAGRGGARSVGHGHRARRKVPAESIRFSGHAGQRLRVGRGLRRTRSGGPVGLRGTRRAWGELDQRGRWIDVLGTLASRGFDALTVHRLQDRDRAMMLRRTTRRCVPAVDNRSEMANLRST
jgi:hypothetical protein